MILAFIPICIKNERTMIECARMKKWSYMTLDDVMIQKGTTFDHDFYVVVCKQCRTENAYVGHQHNIFI